MKKFLLLGVLFIGLASFTTPMNNTISSEDVFATCTATVTYQGEPVASFQGEGSTKTAACMNAEVQACAYIQDHGGECPPSKYIR